MRAPRSLVVPLLAVASIATAGCSADAGGPAGGDAGRPAGGGAQAAGASGADLYAAHCASCHGADLRGTDKGPSHLSIVYEPDHHGDDAFRAAIANGVRRHHWPFGDMPPVEGLTDAEVDRIITHVRTVQQAEGFEPYPPR